ncbi:MAG: hypothetical protein RM347_016720 [Nostoc sp. ChiQUE02]|uniref:hypothetical protein n=1 Tax=Nostoc sp. ChiQUE02 TaxID=3075377 RepID=UPI002AD59EF0|nr:hypothetical protein [Nostoc sp. ChiQUE02]MDZ8229024.1 hypothetical protein [Nostoc sp. ChiQUE02]
MLTERLVSKDAVPLAYGTLRERGSKLRVASRREVQAMPTLGINNSYKYYINLQLDTE